VSSRIEQVPRERAAPGQGNAAAQLLLSSYDWESDRETITLGDAIQRFRDVNGYIGLPVPAKPHFLKLFRKLINGSRPPEEIYLVHDASHVLTGTTFTHDEPMGALLWRGPGRVRSADRVVPPGGARHSDWHLQSGL
jgi:hypothetical protein